MTTKAPHLIPEKRLTEKCRVTSRPPNIFNTSNPSTITFKVISWFISFQKRDSFYPPRIFNS